jgi:hypothetical protein
VVLKAKNGWGSGDSSLAYLRFSLSGDDEIDGKSIDSLLSVSLDLWMLQTEGDVANDLQVFALVDDAQDAPSSLSETSWTSSAGAVPLLGTNLPQGNHDPVGSALTTVMLGIHTFSSSGDNNELGLVQIPLTVPDLKALIENDSNGEITLIVRSTSDGLSADFASVANTDGGLAPPALTVTALPDPPSGLGAIAVNGSVLLDWDSHTDPNWSSFKVYRATSTGAYGQALESGLASSDFVDGDVSIGTTYYYVVTAVDIDGNESYRSEEVSATAEEAVSPEGTVLFGSENQGFAGFTQSASGSTEIWSLQPDSVSYENRDTGTKNSSFLREFPLNRADGNRYTIEGLVQLTDGYADDNNRIGIYLFGDSDVAPNEDETGALCLLLNLDTGMLRLMEGIDKSMIAETDTGRGMDNSLFSNNVKFTASILFTGNDIQITGIFTDEFNASTNLSTTVPAASYTGDYFGFATRSRSRNFGVVGDARSAPFIMDYESFYLSWDNEPVSDYVQWASGWGTDIGGLADDHEPDGLINLMEYALGGNPLINEAAGILPKGSLVAEGGSNWFYYSYDRRDDAAERGLSYLVFSGTYPADGLTNEVPVWSVSPTVNGFETATHRIPIDGASRGFVRLEVELTE